MESKHYFRWPTLEPLGIWKSATVQRPAAILNIHMMVRSGRNRTEAELGDLLFASGCQVLRVIPTAGPDLLEARLNDGFVA